MAKILKREMVFSGAHIEGDHRYELTRVWDTSKPKCLWIMLNPSVADCDNDDPTIKRVISFTESHGYGGFYVANLIPYITPNPKELISWMTYVKYHKPGTYWVGKNLSHIQSLAKAAGHKNIIFAWGTRGDHHLIYPTVVKVVAQFGKYAKMFDLTANNHPKHPLYLSSDSRLVAFPYNEKKW